MGAIPYEVLKRPKKPKKRKPIRCKKVWKPVRKPIPKINVEATKKRMKRRRVNRNSPEEKEARRIALDRSQGFCECGCKMQFDKSDGQYSPDYPEFHHTRYGTEHRAPEGIYVRRECHHRIELLNHPTRRRNY